MSVKDSYQRHLRYSSSPVDNREDERCVSGRRLFEIANTSLDSVPVQERLHIQNCLRCASQLRILHSARLLAALPLRWSTHLGNATRAWQSTSTESTFQLLGAIQFATRAFAICQEDEWVPCSRAMRINLVFDQQLEFFSLTVLDIPIGVANVSIISPFGLQPLKYDEINSTFELCYFEGQLVSGDEPLLEYRELRSLLLAHKLQIVIDMRPAVGCNEEAQPNDVIEVLQQHQAIERNADYILPCGSHSDTYINTSSLCASEESMQFLAAKIDFLFWDKHFDTVLANGWAMALIGRRLAAAREAQGRNIPMRQVLSEGYVEPMLLDDIVPGSQVIIVLDVIVSGRLADELRRIVQAAGGDVVGIAGLVRPHGSAPLPNVDQRSLCEVEMELSRYPTAKGRSGDIPQQAYNPIAGCMTAKSSSSRSPSQFLHEDSSARELWRAVQAAGAYEHHRREGDTHYIGFVDTRKLLQCKGVGKSLVHRLVDGILKSGNRPEFLVIPRRSRASVLAKMMVREFEVFGTSRPEVLVARKAATGSWVLSPDEFAKLENEDVLIVDTAAGHGRTIDQLAGLIGKARARRIGASVLLSRLTRPCEDSFNLRLTGGFHRLFNLPIRPVAIRGDRVDLCPICRRKNAIRQFADHSDIEALELWAESLFKVRRGPVEQVRRTRQNQRMLFEVEYPFLSGCGAAVASGVTLHALGSAGTQGSASLSLPELFDDRIPWRVKATMVENLPPGILTWAGGTLVADLVNVLASGAYPSIWKATANLLSREGSDIWLNYLESMLDRVGEAKHRVTESFWNHMACNAYLLVANGSDNREQLLLRIEQMLGRQLDQAVQSGLRQMREVIRD